MHGYSQLELELKTLQAGPCTQGKKQGKHLWNIEQTCGSTKINETMNLTLSDCRAGEFTCRDSQCIKMGERCDQIAR